MKTYKRFLRFLRWPVAQPQNWLQLAASDARCRRGCTSIMALARGLADLRATVLSRIRLPAQASLQSIAPPVAFTLLRGFAEGTYLDKNQVTERILNVVKNFDKVDESKVTPSASFQKDLGLDSLDTVEVVMAFEEEFSVEIPDSEADKILTTADAISYLSSHPQAK